MTSVADESVDPFFPFPTWPEERGLCGVALAVVRAFGSTLVHDHLDAVILVSYPRLLAQYTPPAQHKRLNPALYGTYMAVFRLTEQPIPYRECLAYLERRGALTVAEESREPPLATIAAGPDFDAAAAEFAPFAEGVDALLPFVREAMRRQAERRDRYGITYDLGAKEGATNRLFRQLDNREVDRARARLHAAALPLLSAARDALATLEQHTPPECVARVGGDCNGGEYQLDRFKQGRGGRGGCQFGVCVDLARVASSLRAAIAEAVGE